MKSDFSPLIATQRWKLWFWSGVLVLMGAGIYAPDAVGKVLGFEPALVTISTVGLGFIVIIGASLSIRCPSCGLSLVWHGLSKKHVDAWLSWLLDVDICPRCGYSHPHDLET